MDKKEISRKEFLKTMGLGLGSIAAMTLLPKKLLAGVNNSTYTYYQMIAKADSCKACKNHAINKRFKTYESADKNRSHKYCSCKIVEKNCSYEEYTKWFKNENIADLRWSRLKSTV